MTKRTDQTKSEISQTTKNSSDDSIISNENMMTFFIKWVAGIAAAIIAGVAIYYLTINRERINTLVTPTDQTRTISMDSITSWSRFNSGGHPDHLAENSIGMHLFWGVWHEGLPLYGLNY